jgi:hypothetical protein
MSTLIGTRTQRLLVTRRNPDSASYETIGELVHDDSGYAFTYAPGVVRPLPGMPDTSRRYSSDELFPLFEHRVISSRRADRDAYLSGLALGPEATPFEVLARSGGRSAVDTLELTPMPKPGPLDLLFLVHGIRHLSEAERRHIGNLRVGQRIWLVPEPDNSADRQAVLVADDDRRLGYVPRPLLRYIHRVRETDHALTVERVNPVEAGYHMRLLVRLRGYLPA